MQSDVMVNDVSRICCGSLCQTSFYRQFLRNFHHHDHLHLIAILSPSVDAGAARRSVRHVVWRVGAGQSCPSVQPLCCMHAARAVRHLAHADAVSDDDNDDDDDRKHSSLSFLQFVIMITQFDDFNLTHDSIRYFSFHPFLSPFSQL